MYYSLLSLKMICFDLFPYASEPSRDFNKSELVSYDFIFFPWQEKGLTGAVNIFSGVSKNRFRQQNYSCNDVVEHLIILRFYNCTPTISYWPIEMKASSHLPSTQASQVSLRTCLRPVIQVQRQMKSQSHLLAYSITNLIASNLHKNSKVCKVITRTRYFIVNFFDQRASSRRPIPFYVGSTIIEGKQRKTIQNIATVIIRKFLFFGCSNNEKVKNIGAQLELEYLSGLRLYGCSVRVVLCDKEMGSTTRNKVCF